MHITVFVLLLWRYPSKAQQKAQSDVPTAICLELLPLPLPSEILFEKCLWNVHKSMMFCRSPGHVLWSRCLRVSSLVTHRRITISLIQLSQKKMLHKYEFFQEQHMDNVTMATTIVQTLDFTQNRFWSLSLNCEAFVLF